MEEQLGKFFSGEATEHEITEIMHWRNESADNAELFFETKKLWIGSENLKQIPPKDIFESIVAEPTKTVGLWSYLRYAAVIAMLLGFGWWWYTSSTSSAMQDILPMVEVHQLEDGTQLNLYKGGTFSVIEMSDQQRVVEMSGKGFFDVVRDESRPFIVLAEGTRVEVLGTSFVVDSEEADRTEVLVASGKVRVSPETVAGESSDQLVLEKGEMGILTKAELKLEKRAIEDENYLAWSSGLLSFDQDQLHTVGTVLEEVYGLEVKFNNSDIGSCQLTAKFQKKRGNEVVRIIAETFDMQYTIEGNLVEFSGSGCR